ncbi:MAG: endonuclease III [candidate division WOR-3 bacterium]
MKEISPCDLFLKIEEYSKNLKVPLVTLIALKRRSDFSTLISAILSSRTKDEVTGRVMENFLKRVKDFNDLKKLKVKEIEKLIYPVGFYKVKAKILKRLSKEIIEKYGGKIPDKFEELVKLPGVGRKVANLILIEIFKKDEICVDTHVHRISNRLGWVNTKKREETEKKLKEIFPREYWSRINRTLVSFGQGVCKPLKPLCKICPVEPFCPKIGL